MKLAEADIVMIHGVLKDYRRYAEHGYEHFSFPYTIMSLKERNTRSEVMSRVLNIAPLITKVLSMELPQGFSLLKTIDEQCLAWKAGIGLHGPVSEFQARLWCWQNAQIDEEVKFNIVDEDAEEATIHGVGEAIEDHTAILCSVGENGAILEESVIESMFSSYRGYRQ